MQLINCNKTVFFNHEITKEYLPALTNKYESIRKHAPEVLKETERFFGKDGSEYIRYH